jgi:hypothetical protein
VPSVTVYATKDVRLYSPNQGAGASDYLPVGLYSGGVYRSDLKFDMPDWTALGIRRVTAAKLKVKNSDQNYIARGGTPRVLARRITESFNEGSSVALSTSNATVYPGPATSGTNEADSGTLSTANGDVIEIDILAMMRQWAPTTVESGGGLTHYGVQLRSFDEGSTARTTEFYSKEAGNYDPRIVITYESNTAPTAPINRTPVIDESGNPALASKFTATPAYSSGLGSPPAPEAVVAFSFTRADADAGDYISAYEVAIHADAATDGTPGSALVSTGKISVSGSPTSIVANVRASALTVGTTYRWRVRTYDKADVVGAWSSFTDARFIPDTFPGKPTNPSVDSNTTTPTFYGTLSDADAGASIGAVQIEVYQDTGLGAIAKWDDDDATWISSSGTRFAIAYAGSSALDFDVAYRWRSRIRDNLGGVGTWGDWQTWTPRNVTGPTALSPISIETKLNTLSPTMTIANGAAFDQYNVEVYRYNDLASTLHYTAGTVAVASTTSTPKVIGPLPDWGRIYYWRARVRPTGGGAITSYEWSPLYPIYVNARPSAPVMSIDNSVDANSTTPAGTNSGQPYRAVATVTPTFRMPYVDADVAKGYADPATRREIEITTQSGASHVTGSPFVITSSITDTFTIGGGVLTAGTFYRVRARYDDASGASGRGDWSPWLYFRVNTAPSATAGTAVDVTDPTPTLDWTFSRTQRAFRAQITRNSDGAVVYDSGLIYSATTDHVVPPGKLEHGVAYTWTVTAYDSDMLPGTLA